MHYILIIAIPIIVSVIVASFFILFGELTEFNNWLIDIFR